MINRIKKSILIITISLFTSALTPGKPEIDISRYAISEISQSGYIIDYQITNLFDYESFSKNTITLPFEKYILNGIIENGILKEKDFLFSQLDADLNGNGNSLDSFRIKPTGNMISINETQMTPLIKETANHHVLVPFNKTGEFNTNRISKNGIPFTLRKISADPFEITLGLNITDSIDFKKLPNSQLLVEIITPDSDTEKNLLIDGQKPFSGFINNRELTHGETMKKFSVVKTAEIKNNISSGRIKIERIQKPFIVLVSYYFAISENLIILKQKTVRVE